MENKEIENLDEILKEELEEICAVKCMSCDIN